MSVTRPAPSQSTRASLEDIPQIQQAGRSTTNLNAEQSASTLRQAARHSSRGSNELITLSTSAPDVIRPHSTTHGRETSDATSLSNNSESALPLETTPSNSSIVSGESVSSKDKISQASQSDVPSKDDASSACEDARDIAALRPATSSTSISRLPAASRLSSSSSSIPRPYSSTPLSNPFDTRNNSQLDISAGTPLPRYNSSTQLLTGFSSTDLANRLADTEKKDDLRPSSSVSARASHSSGSIPRDRIFTTEKSAGAFVQAVPRRVHTPSFISEADPEKTMFIPHGDDRSIHASLYVDQKEDDDDMHMPQWDDDVRYRPALKDRFSKRNITNTFGMIFLSIGLLCIFVILPVVSWTGTSLLNYSYETPLEQMPGYHGDLPAWQYVNNKKYPPMYNVRRGLIDPDTPESAMKRTAVDGSEMVLVFSDEFNSNNRTFYPGDDAYWSAPDFWYGATQDLEWYDPDAVNTGGGTLQLQLDKFPNHGLDYRSGMLNSWNQLCFKGGAFEVSMSLPGPGGKHGFWPGAWTMGNLGRPGYLATTDGIWPYTYDSCDAGITPNQSSPDGISFLPGQRLSSCTCSGEDHPTPGRGRGAPEIDIAEISATWGGAEIGVATQSFQVAPFDVWYYPNYDFMQNPNYSISQVNTWVGGPYQQAVSTTSMLNNNWYDGKEFQTYAYEYKPGSDKNAYLAWFIGGEEMMKFDARAIGPNGNVGQRLISEEPMSIILNLGFSHNWVDIDWSVLSFPTVLQIDYVRWYQPADSVMVTCDPPGYETTEYIKDHPEPYNNNNLTHWADTGYSWPKNKLMNQCS